MTSRLSPAALEAALAAAPHWQHDPRRGAIARSFRFADFGEAFGFMTRLALLAERLGHHPEWRNVYDQVDIVLTTHDADGLSALDFEFARQADAVYRGPAG